MKAVRGWRRERREARGVAPGRLVDQLNAEDVYVEEDDVSPGQRTAAALAYFALVAALTFLP